MPLHDQSGAELPSYQAYLCLAWLVAAGLLERHGRQGYTIPNAQDLDRDLDAAWAKFNGVSKEMGLLNADFAKRKLEAIQPMSEEAWRKK